MTVTASVITGRRRLVGCLAVAAALPWAATLATTPAAAVTASLPGPVAADHPAGLAFDGSSLVVASTGTGTVRRYDGDGSSHLLLSGLVPGSFDRGVTGVAVDGSGDVYVGSTDAGAVLVVTPDGRSGTYARGLGAPYGLAFRADGTLLVADASGNRLLAVSPKHMVSTVAALPAAPFSVAIGPDGAAYVSLLRTGAIERVDSAGAVSTYATIPAADGSVPDAEGLAFDSTGALYAGAGAGDTADSTPKSTGAVVRVAPGGNSSAPVADNLSGPLNLAFAPGGSTLYVATQAEGAGNTTNHVVLVPTAAAGMALAHPHLHPSFLAAVPPAASVFAPGGGTVEGGVAVDPAPFATELPQPYMADTGQNAGEPNIAVTHSGDVYMDDISFNGSPCDPGGIGGFPASHLRQSTDGGRTFKDAEPAFLSQMETSSPPCSLDPYLWYDRTGGRLVDGDLIGACSYFQASDNDGGAWSPQPVCGAGELDDHETIASGPPPAGVSTSGWPTVFYYCFQTVAYAGCNRSLDGGSSWSTLPSMPYSNVDGGCGAVVTGGNGEQTGHVVVGGDGTVYLPKANCSNGPVVAISHDAGQTWTQVLVHAEPQAQDHEAAVAVDSAGTVYYDWIDGTTLLPMLSVSHDDGATWSAPIDIAPPGVTEGDQPALNAGGAGRVVAYFYGTTGDCCYGRTDKTKLAQDNPTTCSDPVGLTCGPTGATTSPWNAYAVISLDASSAHPTFMATPMNDPRVPLVRGNCGPGRCSNSFDYWDTYIDDSGRLWTSITNECLTSQCSKPGLYGSSDGVAEGFAGQLLCGPRLDGAGVLKPPAWTGASSCPMLASASAATPTPAASPTSSVAAAQAMPHLPNNLCRRRQFLVRSSGDDDGDRHRHRSGRKAPPSARTVAPTRPRLSDFEQLPTAERTSALEQQSLDRSGLVEARLDLVDGRRSACHGHTWREDFWFDPGDRHGAAGQRFGHEACAAERRTVSWLFPGIACRAAPASTRLSPANRIA